jgi:hypothetical protein
VRIRVLARRRRSTGLSAVSRSVDSAVAATGPAREAFRVVRNVAKPCRRSRMRRIGGESNQSRNRSMGIPLRSNSSGSELGESTKARRSRSFWPIADITQT